MTRYVTIMSKSYFHYWEETPKEQTPPPPSILWEVFAILNFKKY